AAADLGQLIRTKLLVGPRLLSYGGRGALQGWVRVIASRMVIDAHRRAQARPESSLEPQVIDALDDLRLDPSTELLRHKYRDDVKQAMEVAFAALSIKERRLLRGALVQRLKTDDLGALFGVHRTTVARWLEDARSSLVERTRAELSRRLDARDDTVRSLIGLVRSTIDLSVTRLLQSRDGDVVP
ncbi:MAG: hypothetical protein JKY37_22020, partial [Nannocystaceae bacterium]|nr:hypothetical protein [Nannocystaceae bacterium]